MECQVSMEHIPPLPDFGERIEVRGSTSVEQAANLCIRREQGVKLQGDLLWRRICKLTINEHYRIGLADP
jgi:hypothetical protein